MRPVAEPTHRPARLLLTAVGTLTAVLVAGVGQASASALTTDAADHVASGTTSAAAPCDDAVTTRLVFESSGGVDTENVVGVEVLDVDPAACAGATVTVTAFDAGGTALLTGGAALPADASSVRIEGLGPVAATDVHSIVVEVS